MRWVLVLSVGLSLPAGWVSAQDEPCEPLVPRAVAVVAERLGLDGEQSVWLRERLERGTLQSPVDLNPMPGLGAELREDLEAAFCWEPVLKGETGALYRRSSGGEQKEWRSHGQWNWMEGAVRLRKKTNAPIVVRGGLTLRRSRWQVGWGSIRRRNSLGLLLQTTGSVVRGSAPLRDARRSWDISLSLEPEPLYGVHVLLSPVGWRLGGVRVFSNPAGRPAWSSATVERVSDQGRLGAAWVFHPAGVAGGVHGRRDVAWGSVAFEWQRRGANTAKAIAYELSGTRWRMKGSWLQVGAGFSLSHQDQYGAPEPDDRVEWRLDARWQPDTDRFLRVAWGRQRRRTSVVDLWPSGTHRQEVEVRERLSTGVRLHLLARVQGGAAFGSSRADEVGVRVLRAEVHVRRGAWRGRVKAETRTEQEGSTMLHQLSVGKGDRSAFELRGAAVRETGFAPAVSVYRRRAGSAYGWNRLSEGVWLGGWTRWSQGRFRTELSLDATASGWEIVVAIHTGVAP